MNWSPTPIPCWSPQVFAPRPARAVTGVGKEMILVLGLQRTASTAARDFLHANFAGDRVVAREHGVSPRHRNWLKRGRDLGLDHFATKIDRFDRLRAALSAARRLWVVVTVREPTARTLSFFLYRNRARIQAFYDPATGNFRDAPAIAADLDGFCRIEARRQQAWVDEELIETLGADPTILQPGRFVAAPGAAAVDIAVVRCEAADADLIQAGAAIGPVVIPPVQTNAMADFGIAAAARAFRDRFRLAPDLTAALADCDPLRRFYAPALAATGS